MIFIGDDILKTVVAAAERAYPEECCGLLIGRGTPAGAIKIARAVSSPNVATIGKPRQFEIDPKVRFGLMRTLRCGPDTIVGHYHSHPDHPARPSPSDVAAAFEPDLVWLITAVAAGRAETTAAFRIDGGRITPIDLVVTKGSQL